MGLEYLEFEKPVAELQEKISELKRVSVEGGLNLDEEIENLQARSSQLTRDIFSKLSAWQITQLARHPLRPYTLDYIDLMVKDFQELHGDRMYADDPSIICGLGLIDGHRVVIIGHQKGKDTRERTWRNFGMPRPEGLSQGPAHHESGGTIQAASGYIDRHPGRLPGDWRRRKRAKSGHRQINRGDGQPEHTDYFCCYR